MSYFEADFISFFKDLSQNNHKDWFHANKKRYEKSVKQPFQKFVGDLIGEIQQYDPGLQTEAKDCILRINKDIRFSKDKSPYNLHYTAMVSSGGRKDKSMPGLFLRFSAEGIDVMGGCYGPDKDQLLAIRSKVAAGPAEFKALLSAGTFKTAFGAVQGEVNKKIPAEFKEVYEEEPLIANKQFYFLAHEQESTITSPRLMEVIMQYWQAARPVNEYLGEAVNQNLLTAK